MGKNINAIIAKETIQVTKDGFYYGPDGLICELPDMDFDVVEVFSPDTLQSIVDDEDEFFERAFYGTNGADFYVIEADSFEAAKELEDPLVMNFANAHVPGGGFLTGANAQEEALCRCSTLYASLSGEKAKEMYEYNCKRKDPLDSDYMLLSPNVAVFRDRHCNPLPEKDVYIVSVVTVPAPNKNGYAAWVRQSEIDICMQERIEKMLWMAARKGYRNLVLGAWGCGAFAHDTRTVANYFYKAFFEGTKFSDFFDTVVFAILHDSEKVEIFKDVFQNHLVSNEEEVHVDESQLLYGLESIVDFPVCNHISGCDENDLGYTQGITMDGIPFECELFQCQSGRGLTVMMPTLWEEDTEAYEEDYDASEMVVPMVPKDIFVDNSILDIGMVDEGEEYDSKMLQLYVNYLVNSGIVKFTTSLYNGAIWYRTDVSGNRLAKIVITLSDKGEVFAETDLRFRPFPNTPKKSGAKIIQFPG